MTRICAKYHAIVSLLLLLVVGSLHYNNVINLHYHILDNGQRIAHAHPVQDSDQDHSHTPEELVWLEIISHPKFTNIDWGLCIASFVPTACEHKLAVYQSIKYAVLSETSHLLRGPPSTAAKHA